MKKEIIHNRNGQKMVVLLDEDKVISNFANSKWHFVHKRFRSPFYTSLIWEGVCFKVKSKIPFECTVNKAIYLDTELAIDEQGWKDVRKRVVNFIKQDPNKLTKLVRQSYEINESVKRFAKMTQKCDLSHKNPIELWEKYRMIMNFFGSYITLPIFIEADLEDELKEFVIKKFGDEQAKEIYQVLTTPIRAGSAQEEEFSLLRLAILKLENKLKTSDVDKHLEKFSWIENNAFVGKFMTQKTLLNRIRQASKTKPKARLENYIDKKKKTDELFKKYYKDFSNNKRAQGVIDVLQELIFWRSWRTERYYSNAYYMQRFFETTAKSLGIKKPTDIFYLTIGEVVDALKNNCVSKDIKIKERKNGYACFAFEDQVVVYSGTKLKEIKQHVEIQTPLDISNVVRGQIAYPGKISGPVVVVVSKDDLKKVKDGVVLVAPSTTIDYVPVLKKVVAIITEEGGVLSHASVISRELHIPCIIGTKNVTQVLKDCDMVEVDATGGIVKKIIK